MAPLLRMANAVVVIEQDQTLIDESTRGIMGRNVVHRLELLPFSPCQLLFSEISAAVLGNLARVLGVTAGAGIQLSAGDGRLGLAPMHDLDMLTHQEVYFVWQTPERGFAPLAITSNGRRRRAPAGRERTAIDSRRI